MSSDEKQPVTFEEADEVVERAAGLVHLNGVKRALEIARARLEYADAPVDRLLWADVIESILDVHPEAR